MRPDAAVQTGLSGQAAICLTSRSARQGPRQHRAPLLRPARSQGAHAALCTQLHHVFADGSYLVGEGAEHAGSKFHPELQEPFYTVIPAGKFEMQPRRCSPTRPLRHSSAPAASCTWLRTVPVGAANLVRRLHHLQSPARAASDVQAAPHTAGGRAVQTWAACRLVNIHIISTLGVPGDRVLPCIECWCQNGTVTRAGKLGGGACCSSSHCQSTLPATELRTYEMQYTVKFRRARLAAACLGQACGCKGRRSAAPGCTPCPAVLAVCGTHDCPNGPAVLAARRSDASQPRCAGSCTPGCP